MKYFFTYGLLAVFILLFHSVMMQEVDDGYTPAGNYQNECFDQLIQDNHTDLHNTSIRNSAMFCELGNTEISNILSIKNHLRLPSRLSERKVAPFPPPAELSHFSISDTSDPIKYYIFGLRKIII